jgi:hypothetical protein
MFLLEITLPLIGTLQMPFILVAPVVSIFVFMTVLVIAIHLDTRPEKAGN